MVLGHGAVPSSRENQSPCKNSKEFASEVRNLKIGEDQDLRSYDVSALFTSVLVDKGFIVIKKRLEGKNPPVTRGHSQAA